MYQKTISFLLGIFLLVSADVIKWEYQVNKAPEVRDGIAYIADGYCAMQPYAPQVAVKRVNLLMPKGHKVKSANIVYGNLVPVAGTVAIKPFLPSVNNTRSLDEQRVQAIYQKDKLFPGTTSPVKKNATGYLYGVGIGMVETAPVQYNPVQEKLYFYDKVTVTVETEPVTAEDDVAAYVGTPFTRSRIYQLVDNKEAVRKLPFTLPDANDYEYLVISRPDLLDGWESLVTFNRRRGMRTKVVNITDILADQTGSDEADKVRNYIKQEYADNKIVFVLLGGDVGYGPNNIPCRLLNAKFYDHHMTPDRYFDLSPAADMYFGTLDGNWNTNGNREYGEPGEEDLFWEVFVSRMCFDNADQLRNCLRKTIKYSENPVREAACSYLGLGEYCWTYNQATIWGADIVDQYIGYWNNKNGHTTYGILRDFSINSLDDKTSGAEYSWSASELAQVIKETKPSWINHVGHGNQSIAYGISSRDIPTVFTNDGIDANFFVGISAAAAAGQFHRAINCFTERLLSSNTGAVALISNNEYMIGDDDGDNWASALVTRYIHDALFNPTKRIHFLEAMHVMGKEAVRDIAIDPNAMSTAPWFGEMRYACYNTNMFGDPALSIWTEKPKDLVQPFSYTADGDKFSMKTPPYTWVALADEFTGKIFTTQLTGFRAEAEISSVPADSQCVIVDEAYKTYAAGESKVRVFIKAHNYLPASFELDIAATGINNNQNNAVQGYSVMTMKGYLRVAFNLTASENVNLSIYNAKGTLVKTVTKSNVKDGLIKIDNSEFSNGIYFCKLITRNAQLVESFVISR